MKEVVAAVEVVIVELTILDVAIVKNKTNNKTVVDNLIARCLLELLRETEVLLSVVGTLQI